jgi:hypothetical protein
VISTGGRLNKTASKNKFALEFDSHESTISFFMAPIHYEPPVKKSQVSAKSILY